MCCIDQWYILWQPRQIFSHLIFVWTFFRFIGSHNGLYLSGKQNKDISPLIYYCPLFSSLFSFFLFSFSPILPCLKFCSQVPPPQGEVAMARIYIPDKIKRRLTQGSSPRLYLHGLVDGLLLFLLVGGQVGVLHLGLVTVLVHVLHVVTLELLLHPKHKR